MLGAGRVISIERVPERLAMAANSGKAETIDIKKEKVYDRPKMQNSDAWKHKQKLHTLGCGLIRCRSRPRFIGRFSGNSRAGQAEVTVLAVVSPEASAGVLEDIRTWSGL